MKIKILLLIILILLATGCVDQSAEIKEENSTNILAIEENDTTFSEVPKNNEKIGEPELKIMSVSAVKNSLVIKIKNIGNSTAKDVYCGVVGTWTNWNFPPETGDYILQQIAHGSMMYGETYYNAMTVRKDGPKYNFQYLQYVVPEDYDNQNLTEFESIIIYGKIINKEYIGDIAPGEFKTSQMDVMFGYDDYIKIVWTDDKEIYTVY